MCSPPMMDASGRKHQLFGNCTCIALAHVMNAMLEIKYGISLALDAAIVKVTETTDGYAGIWPTEAVQSLDKSTLRFEAGKGQLLGIALRPTVINCFDHLHKTVSELAGTMSCVVVIYEVTKEQSRLHSIPAFRISHGSLHVVARDLRSSPKTLLTYVNSTNFHSAIQVDPEIHRLQTFLPGYPSLHEQPIPELTFEYRALTQQF
eukprot:TRINITY_DN50360_c0_g1_i1.p1 TRINITY_DN50360_c0_g1~~TRINITY_DN50360_c0_g1_i1.p1  ORF type:complete len:222 (-),score=14.69 TRINITY_DN50360_c0_g1_i1:535-1149(-)